MCKKFFGFIGILSVILLMTAAVLVFLAPRFGWRVDSVYSGSMEPAMNVGSVVITRPVLSESIRTGDIITFMSLANNSFTSHRVIAVADDFHSGFRTKGDANESTDPFVVPAESVAGVVCFHLPYLGYLAEFMKTRLGLLLTLCLPGLVIVIRELINIWQVLRWNEI